MNVPFSPDALYSLISPARFNGKPTDLREGEEEKCVFQSLCLFREQWCLSQPLTLHRPSSSAAEEEPGAAGLTLSFTVSRQSRLSELRFPHLESLTCRRVKPEWFLA